MTAASGRLPMLTDLPAEHLCDISVDLQPAQLISTPLGTRMTFIAAGGRVSGPRLRGTLLPGGGDWLLIGADGVGRVDVRATIRTDDGVLVHFTSRGVVTVPADGLNRLGAGETLPFADTYVRTTPVFDTADPRYRWLAGLVAVGYNVLSPDRVDYRVYRLR